jgi:hypothetical protein
MATLTDFQKIAPDPPFVIAAIDHQALPNSSGDIHRDPPRLLFAEQFC